MLNNFVNFKLIEMDKTLKESFGNLDLVQIIHWINKSYDQVNSTTTLNCWKKLNSLFLPSQENMNNNKTEKIENVEEKDTKDIIECEYI